MPNIDSQICSEFFLIGYFIFRSQCVCSGYQKKVKKGKEGDLSEFFILKILYYA